MIIAIIEIVFLVLMAVVVHEFAHGWVACRLGDDTAKNAGRLTLNPLAHIDPLGTVILPLILWHLGSFIFGWARPVPVNFSRLRNPKRDMVLVAAAGPAVNFAMAMIIAGLLHMGITGRSSMVLVQAVWINLFLGVFNLIPVPPLDGGRILTGLLPDAALPLMRRIEPFGILIAIVLLNSGFFGVIDTVVYTLAGFLGLR